MIHATAPVPDAAVTADPRLRGRTLLQIYDAVVAALAHEGFAVVLNNHTSTSRWCCGVDGKPCSPCGCGRAATGTREPPRPPAPTACGWPASATPTGGDRVSAALCVPSRTALGRPGRTLRFDRSDHRPAGDPGGEFAQAATRASAPPTSTPPASPSPPASAARRAPRPCCAARCGPEHRAVRVLVRPGTSAKLSVIRNRRIPSGSLPVLTAAGGSSDSTRTGQTWRGMAGGDGTAGYSRRRSG
jgi:hypothetical protein